MAAGRLTPSLGRIELVALPGRETENRCLTVRLSGGAAA